MNIRRQYVLYESFAHFTVLFFNLARSSSPNVVIIGANATTRSLRDQVKRLPVELPLLSFAFLDLIHYVCID